MEILERIYNACDPARPATENQYVDCTAARGSEALAQRIVNHLELAQDHVCAIFSGHIGCGKSTELMHLSRTLARPNPPAGTKRFFPIVLNMADYLDDFDVDLIDVLLAIVTEVAAALREQGIELKDSYFSKRFDEIKGYLLSDIEINKGEIPILGGKIEVQRLKQNQTARQRVRDALNPAISSVIDEVNGMLIQAETAIQGKVLHGEKAFDGIVLILDNLERIRQFAGKATAFESARELFLERYTVLTAFKVHVIYTVPLRLVRSHVGAQLSLRYGSEPMVLPMVKVAERNRVPYLKGIRFLEEALQKRLGDLPLHEAFDADALQFLIRYSGGHLRHLLNFVQNACAYSRTQPQPLPLTLQSVQASVRQMVRTFSTSIPDPYWEKLAQLDLSTTQRIPNGDEDYLNMLENLSVLEYINGGEAQDIFADEEPWYAVHPVVRELGAFTSARNKIKLAATSGPGG